MHYMFAPLDRHFDRGFGSVGNAFKEAADAIEAMDDGRPFLNAHLPTCFLYRHAAELFLKSSIVVVHRRLEIPYGDAEKPFPQVLSNGKWKAMHSEHGLTPLYEYSRSLYNEHAKELHELSNMAWDIEPEVSEWIAQIDATDFSSTFFRYPVTKHAPRDNEKSTFKSVEELDLADHVGKGKPRLKALVVLNENDEIVDFFRHDAKGMEAVLATLKKTADLLYGFHAATRMKLTGGW